MQNGFRIGSRLINRTCCNEIAAKHMAVGKIAVMSNRDAARCQFSKQWLHIAQDSFARSGITCVANCAVAFQPIDHFVG